MKLLSDECGPPNTFDVNIGSGNGLPPDNLILAIVDPDICHNMVSLDHNELNGTLKQVLLNV